MVIYPTRAQRRKRNPQSPNFGKRRQRGVPHPRRGNIDARRVTLPQFSVYDGRDRQGSFCRVGDTFEAFDRRGKSLGSFTTQREACEVIERGGAS